MSLLSPWFLVGLAGLALPWLLHRFSRNPPLVADFPSSSFLEATEPPVSRRHKLRFRALFSARVLALLLLCLLFAEPWWGSVRQIIGTDRLDLVVLDQSLSMQAGNRWRDAQDEARQVIEALPAGARVQVIGTGARWQGSGESGSEEAARDASAAQAQVRSLAAGFGRIDYGDLMQRLDARAAAENAPVFVTFITDAQASSLPAQSLRLSAPSLAGFNVIDVGGEPAFNQTVQARAFVDDDNLLQIDVQIDGHGPAGQAAGAERELQIRWGEEMLVRSTVPAEPGRQTLVFDDLGLPAGLSSGDEPAGSFVLQASLQAGDALAADDSVGVAVDDASMPLVALLGLGGSVPADARAFVSTALISGDTARVLDVPATAAQELRLETSNAIVFLPAEQWIDPPESLRAYVRDGGNVLSMPLDSTAPPGQAAVPGSVGRIDRSHPLDVGRIDWTSVRWYDLPSEARWPDAVRVLVQTSRGDPVLLDRSEGRGHWLLLNDTLDASGSDLPLQPAMVQLMDSVVRWFASDQLFPDRLTSGERLSLPARHQLIGPDGRNRLTLSQTASASEQVLDEPGVYTVDDSEQSRLLSVLSDPAESNLLPIAAAELQAWQQRHEFVESEDTQAGEPAGASDELGTDSASAASTAAQNVRRVPAMDDPDRWALWAILLPVLALLWAGESLWGNRHLQIRRAG